VLGVLWERDGLVRSPFILVLASGLPLLLFLSLFFLASETYTISRASEQTIILRCTTLHYPFIIHHTITFPPPVLPSSRRSIDLVHQRRSPAPTPLPSLPTTTGRRDGVAGEAGSFSTIVTFPAMLFVWQEFLRWCLGHSFGIIGEGADGRGEGMFSS
jgi:hypothetical protein